MSDWKYDLDEVGEDADDDADSSPEGEAPADDEFDPIEAREEPLEPGSPTLENAFFVALGVATTLLAFARVVLLAGG